jgi:hypothetical protein
VSGTPTSKRATSVKAVAGSILALLAVSLWLFTDLSGFPVAVLALGLAGLGLGDIERSSGRLRGKTLAVMVLLTPLLAIPLYILALPACQTVAEARWSGIMSGNLKQLALAMHAYRDEHGTFPPYAIFDEKGRPLLSWRVAILPHIEQKELYQQFKLDEPWDGPHNRKLLAKMPEIYLHPLRDAREEPFTTHFRVFVGKGAAFEGERGMRVAHDFPDGTSNTILIVEAARAVPWTRPEELHYAPDWPVPKLGGFLSRGLYAVFADGSVRVIPQETSESTLRALITRNGGDDPGPDW